MIIDKIFNSRFLSFNLESDIKGWPAHEQGLLDLLTEAKNLKLASTNSYFLIKFDDSNEPKNIYLAKLVFGHESLPAGYSLIDVNSGPTLKCDYEFKDFEVSKVVEFAEHMESFSSNHGFITPKRDKKFLIFELKYLREKKAQLELSGSLIQLLS